MAFFIRRTTWTKLEVDGEVEGLGGVDGMMGVVRVEGMMAEQGAVAKQGMVFVVRMEGVVAKQGMVAMQGIQGVEEGVEVALGSETVHCHQHQKNSQKNCKTHLSSGHIWILAFSKNRR